MVKIILNEKSIFQFSTQQIYLFSHKNPVWILMVFLIIFFFYFHWIFLWWEKERSRENLLWENLVQLHVTQWENLIGIYKIECILKLAILFNYYFNFTFFFVSYSVVNFLLKSDVLSAWKNMRKFGRRRFIGWKFLLIKDRLLLDSKLD